MARSAQTPPRNSSRRILPPGAFVWLALFFIVVIAGLARFSPTLVRTDVTDLLPETIRETSAAEVLSHVAGASARDIWILVSHPDPALAQKAVDAFASRLKTEGLSAGDPAESIDFSLIPKKLLAWRENFLTERDRTWLETADDKKILSRAARLLYRPVAPSGWNAADDPLGFFENWLLEQGTSSNFVRISGRTAVRTPENTTWFVLQLQSSSAIAAVGEAPLTKAVATAASAAENAAGAGTRVLAAGIPLISEAVAQRASREAAFIGAISMAGIALVILAFFARLAPLVETAGVLLLSVVFAFSATILVFGEIHVITIVFGATLLGICVDYVFHLLCAVEVGRTGLQARTALLKPLSASLVSTLAGYAIMLVTPMPGLRQVSLFCMAGLICTFLSVMLWMAPVIPAAAPDRTSAFARWFTAHFVRLPRLASMRSRTTTAVAALIFIVPGMMQLSTTNELRLISGADPALLARQALVSTLLNPASPAQFFVVEGKNDCEVLERIAALETRFSAAGAQAQLAGADLIAPTRFLTPCNHQLADHALVKEANGRARAALSLLLQEDLSAAPAVDQVLHVSDWKTIVPEPLSRTWISDEKAVVLIAGVTPANVAALSDIALALEGVTFVDTTADLARSLAELRDAVLKALAMAAAAIAIVLIVFFRRSFLKLWIPSIAGILLTLAVMGWCGIALSLFSVLPFVLVLGLGVDYAILLQDAEERPAAGNSVFLAASSTLLAFGLLAFSATPALHLFGLTLALALVFVVILTILLRPGDSA